MAARTAGWTRGQAQTSIYGARPVPAADARRAAYVLDIPAWDGRAERT